MALHPGEVHEQIERAHTKESKATGLTIAVLAVPSAFVTILMSQNNTGKVVIETKTTDWWVYTHSNNTSARLYEASAKIAGLYPGAGARVAADLRRERELEQKKSHHARVMAQKLEGESAALTRQRFFYSAAELFLQFSVILCSVALLTDLIRFRKSSFVGTAPGLQAAIAGLLPY